MSKILILLSVLCLAPHAACAQQPAKPAESASAAQKDKTRTQLLNDEKDELKAQYDLMLQKQRNKLAEVEAEYNRLNTENRLSSEKAVSDLALLKTDLDKAASENKLADEKLKAAGGAQNSELQKLLVENKLADETAKKNMADIAAQLGRLKLSNDLQTERLREQTMSDAKEKSAIDLELKRLDLKERKLKIDKMAMDSRVDKINSDLSMRAKKEEWKREANTEPVYTQKPFSDGKLVVSDRRIALNGPIFNGSADEVTDRIHYFNNISSAPVFIVIDNSPGGSVMSGYRILKAMQASRAPVYVVVKSFAASMAAVITTMADKSYVYPNAIILHHQMSSMNWGNMTQLKEQLDMARQWEQRLHVPVAQKMGVTMDQLRKMMYEHNSDGDWQEFGDKAVGYKWATAVVDRIEETGLIKNPDALPAPRPDPRSYYGQLEEKTDDKGQRFAQLPRLDPCDFYFIYNPDRYYR